MNGDDVRALLAAGDDLAERLRYWIAMDDNQPYRNESLAAFQEIDAWRKAAKAVRRDPYDNENPIASRRADA